MVECEYETYPDYDSPKFNPRRVKNLFVKIMNFHPVSSKEDKNNVPMFKAILTDIIKRKVEIF